ncbi:MAG: DNA translocase FtsK 4TM domain-containing protein [Actinomycetota bacterium]|nr:MAG: DNA translocase FtsK 4TM domain-containing protein [Actinomycetota bacterium]
MPTWGPDKRRTARASRTPAASKVSKASKSRQAQPAAAAGKRAAEPRSELREAVHGREDELWGIALVGAGVLAALGVYLRLAGPLGRAVSTALGWLAGLGRFAIPVILVGVGVALIREGRHAERTRLVLGGALVSGAVLGLLHVARGPSGLSGVSELKRGGGWLGALLGVPLVGLLGTVGASVLLVALAVAGLMLLTKASLRSMVSTGGHAVGGVVGPLSRRARKAFGDLATLSSDRNGQAGGSGEFTDATWPAPPPLYDAALEDDASPRGAKAGGTRGRKSLPAPVVPGEPGGEQGELALGPGAARGQWVLPPATLLVRSGTQTIDRAEVESRGRTLEESLASHGVETNLAGMTVGPTVTRYELELGLGVKVARVTSLQRDIAYALAATDVRILAPIPGRSAIGIEVPNHTRQLVSLGDILSAPEAKHANHPLDVAIGKDIAGRAVFLNLATTPHLLIAGATGAGKSSGLNCIITSLLMRTTPDQVRLILVDPKQVEMGQYSRLPHLLTQPVTNPKKAANALAWAVKEMERRYDVLYEVGFRDVTGYNAAFDRGELQPEPGSDRQFERMPYIVVVVDELNDLMMVAQRDVEESIIRISQKARAVGIHLIVATQRPSVNVITGVIKANVPARMAFAVSSLTDSRVVLDQSGAEKLVGKGDMLLLPGNSNVAQRIQGSWVSEEEVRKVVAHWRRQAPEVQYVSGVEEGGETAQSAFADTITAGGADSEDEVLLKQAMELVVRSQLGSTSMLQRKLKVGFARAGRLMDELEQRGVVGASEGSKARAVLMSIEEFELLHEAEGR